MEAKLSQASVVKPTKEQVSCDLAGEAVILELRSGEYFGLNEVGARIWNLIQESKTVGEIFQAVLEEYDADPNQIEHDLVALLEEMATKGLIEVENGKPV